jgi:hypothetical protein
MLLLIAKMDSPRDAILLYLSFVINVLFSLPVAITPLRTSVC